MGRQSKHAREGSLRPNRPNAPRVWVQPARGPGERSRCTRDYSREARLGQHDATPDCAGFGFLRRRVIQYGELLAEVEVAATGSATIETFVVGAPGSEHVQVDEYDPRSMLSEMAVRGNTSFAGCSHSGPDYCHADLTQDSEFPQFLQPLVNIMGEDCWGSPRRWDTTTWRPAAGSESPSKSESLRRVSQRSGQQAVRQPA